MFDELINKEKKKLNKLYDEVENNVDFYTQKALKQNLLNKIHHEDCLETIEKIKEANEKINLVITSPPYNMNLRIRNGKYCSRQITKEFSTKYDGFNDNLPIEEYYAFHLKVLKELIEISDMVFYNIQIVTGSKRAFFKIIGELSNNLKEIIVWDKGHAQPAMGTQILNRQSELLLVFEKEDKAISRQFSNGEFSRGELNDIWLIKPNKKRKTEEEKTLNHSASFPKELVEKILLNFSKENDVIYDPFSGTGTTAIVSKKLNRNFIGSEIVKSYADFANKKLDNF